MKSFGEKYLQLLQFAVFLGGVALTIGIGFLDFALGEQVTFISIYLVPIVIVTWFTNRTYGFILSLLCAVAWFVSYFIQIKMKPDLAIAIIDSVLKLGVLSGSVILIRAFKNSLSREKELSRIDDLTGLFNRRYLYNFLQSENLRARRYHIPLSIVYLDIDDFKKINDGYGHRSGDKVLTDLGRILKRNIRSTDICARLGGDEFAIILIQSDAAAAEKVVHKLMQKIKSGLNKKNRKVRASIGVATFMKPGASATRMIELADGLMYRVKSRGKNGIEYKVFKRHV